MPNLQRNCFHQMQFIPGPQRRAWSNWGCGWWLVVTNNTMALYSMKQYSMVWYGMVWYGVVISNLHLARVNFFPPASVVPSSIAVALSGSSPISIYWEPQSHWPERLFCWTLGAKCYWQKTKCPLCPVHLLLFISHRLLGSLSKADRGTPVLRLWI